MRDSEGNALGLSEMLQELAESTAHMSEADKVATLGKLVGTEAVSGFLQLIKAGPTEIDRMSEALRNSAGASAEASAAMKSGIGGALENMSGAFSTLMIKIGDQLIPYVQIAAEWLTKLADKFSGLREGTKKFLVVGTALVGVFTAIMTGIGILFMAVGSIISAFTAVSGLLASIAGALGIAGGATGLLGAAFAAITGPIGLAVAAVAGIIAVLVVAYNKVWWFNEAVNAAWVAIKEATKIAFDAIKGAITKAIEAVLKFVKPQLDKFRQFWNENGKAITDLVKTYFNNVKHTIQGVMGVIKGIFQVVWPIISAVVKNAWETIKLAVSTAINLVLGVIQTVLKILQGNWKGAWETIKKTVSDIWADIGKFLKNIDLAETGKDIIRGLIKGIKSMGKVVTDAVKGIVGNISKMIKDLLDIHSPSRVTEKLGIFTGQGMVEGLLSIRRKLQSAASKVASWATPGAPTLSYYTPSIRGASNSAVHALESNLQIQFAEAEARRGDIVLNMDGREVARVQQPYLQGMNGQSLNLAMYTKGVSRR